MASDKLFYWLFQNQPDRIVSLLTDLPVDAGGYQFSAPVLKEREYRLDGLFLPPADRPELPAVILEAQMAADPGFFMRLYAETARLLQQQAVIRNWRVVVLCPSRQLNFGDPSPVIEFLEQRVQWLELLPSRQAADAPLLLQALGLLVQVEDQVAAAAEELRVKAAGTAVAADLNDVINAIFISRFSSRSIQEVCALGGVTIEDFSKSVAYQEIFGLGEARGEARGKAEGKAEGESTVILRLLQRRCGPINAATTARIQALPLEQLEALAEALLDFSGPADLTAWLK
jgi:predicted transposase YdaD